MSFLCHICAFLLQVFFFKINFTFTLLHDPVPLTFLVVVVNIIWWMVMVAAIGMGTFIILLFLTENIMLWHLIVDQNVNINIVVLLHHRGHSSEPLSCAVLHPHLSDSDGCEQPHLFLPDLHQEHLERWCCLHPELCLHVFVAPLQFLLVHCRWEKYLFRL